MFLCRTIATLLSLLVAALALQPPSYNGYSRVWYDSFAGGAGSLPNPANWNVISRATNYNNEYEKYTSSSNNVRLSGTGRFQLIPRYDTTAPKHWTSGRVESKYILTPTAGNITRIESQLRLAGNAAVHKQGIWPAFWLLGNAYRQGVPWPGVGEIDIMENINGQTSVYSSLHCDKSPGGVCNEPIGLTAQTSLSDAGWHTWRVEINRKSSNYKQQSITWFRDGSQFHQVTGTQIGSSTVWAALCQKPLYIILNVAVGGDWPGPPNKNTWGGTGSMMEVAYVAHYVSA